MIVSEQALGQRGGDMALGTQTLYYHCPRSHHGLEEVGLSGSHFKTKQPLLNNAAQRVLGLDFTSDQYQCFTLFCPVLNMLPQKQGTTH